MERAKTSKETPIDEASPIAEETHAEESEL